MLRSPVFWSYLRWSTPPQEFGDSEHRQLEPGRLWAQQRGIPFVDEYRDEGVSAWTGKNLTKGALGRFLADIGSPDMQLPQPGDYLGVESTDRLSRSEYLFDATALLNDLFHKRITLVLLGMGGIEVNREIVRESPNLGSMLISELQRGAAESTMKSNRVRAARATYRQRARESGTPMSGETCAAWLRLVGADRRSRVPGVYEIYEPVARIVRQIFEWAATGRGGAWIAHELNRTNTPTFRRIGPKWQKRIANGNGPRWHPAVIRQLLTDRRVLGYVQPCRRVDGKRVPDAGGEVKLYPPVIDEILFARVLANRRQPHPAGRKDRGIVNLVSGLCRCAVCQKGVVLRHQRGRDYLVCEMARHGDCKNGRYFPYKVFERELLGWLGGAKNILAPQMPKPSGEIEKLESRLQVLRHQRRRLVERFAVGDPDADALIESLDTNLRQLNVKLLEARRDDLIGRRDPWREERLHEAARRLYSDGEAARATLAAELRKCVKRVFLHPDRTVVVRFQDIDLSQIVIGETALLSWQGVDPDGNVKWTIKVVSP